MIARPACSRCWSAIRIGRQKSIGFVSSAPQFWRNVDAANLALFEIDEIKSVLTRLESLQLQLEAIAKDIDRTPSARQLELTARCWRRLGSPT